MWFESLIDSFKLLVELFPQGIFVFKLDSESIGFT